MKKDKKIKKDKKWKAYTCSYEANDGLSYTFKIYATSFKDAEKRMKWLKQNATVDGVLV
jgi:hypothetical protein